MTRELSGFLAINPDTQEAKVNEIALPLTPEEYALLLQCLLTVEQNTNGRVFRKGDFTFDQATLAFTVKDREIHLTPMQRKLMQYAMSRPYTRFTKDDLTSRLWEDSQAFARETGVRQLVSSTRKIIELDPANPRYLRTLPGGRGYTFYPDGTGEGRAGTLEVENYDCFRVDTTRGELVLDNGLRIRLWPSEEGLLRAFALNPGRLLTPEALIRKGLNGRGTIGSLKQDIHTLRMKVPGIHITAVLGEGYMYDP